MATVDRGGREFQLVHKQDLEMCYAVVLRLIQSLASTTTVSFMGFPSPGLYHEIVIFLNNFL